MKINAALIAKSVGLTALATTAGGVGMANILDGIGLQIEANHMFAKENITKEEKKAAWKLQIKAMSSLGVGVACTAIGAGMGNIIGATYFAAAAQSCKPVKTN